MDRVGAARDSRGMVAFVVERMDLTDAQGEFAWNRAFEARLYGEVQGDDALGALASVVARDGGEKVGMNAVCADGQALLVVKKGRCVYALRAVPRLATNT